MSFKTYFTKVLPILVVIATIYAFFNGDVSSGLGGLVLILIIGAIVFYVIGRRSKCPECGKIYAMKTAGKTLIGEENISMKIQNEVRNRDGKVTSTYDQMIPGKRQIYEVKRVCKHCGKIETYKETKDIPSV